MRSAVRWVVLLAVVATGFLAGCRRPEAVTDRFPQPISMRDVGRAEVRSGIELTEPERITIETLLDEHQAAFEALRQADIASLLAEIRDSGEEVDDQELRRRIARHRSIHERIAGLDSDFFDRLSSSLGPDRAAFVEILRARRTLDRANAVVIADGGRTLLDLRSLVRSLRLSPEAMATIEPELARYEVEVTPIATAVADAQMRLPIEYQEVLRRRGPPEKDIDQRLRDDAREKAIGAAQQRRFAEARRDLEVDLHRFADTVDVAGDAMIALLPAEDGLVLRRALLRIRIDDGSARVAERAAFDALVASKLSVLPVATRLQIAALRQKFLEEDEASMREWLELWRATKVPGELEPGGSQSTKQRNEQRGAIEKRRAVAAAKLRDEVMNLVPPQLRSNFESLPQLNRQEFSKAIAELVGDSAASAIVQVRPRGYGDREQRPPEAPERAGDNSAEFRILLPAAPDQRDLMRLAERSGVDEGTRRVMGDLFAPWSERWKNEAEAAEAAMQPLVEEMGESVRRRGGDDAERAMARVVGAFENIRQARIALDAELLADLDAAASGLSPEARQLWIWERAALATQLGWRQLPGNELLRFPPESTVDLFDVIADANLSSEALPILVGAIEPRWEELHQTGEQQRTTTLAGVRKIVLEAITARTRGMSEEQALSEERPDIRRAVAPAREAAERFGTIQLEILDSCIAGLPPADGRKLRETFARAAYPRVLGDDWRTRRLIEGLQGDGGLDESQGEAIARLLEERDIRRDRALDLLLAWGRSHRREAGEEGRGEWSRRRYPELAAAAFARDEADARALRAAWGVLRPEQRERHGDLRAWFGDPPQAVRNFD